MAKSDDHFTETIAIAKVLYLLAVTAAVFAAPVFVPNGRGWLVILGLLALQLVILLTCRVGLSDIARPVWRLKWLFIFLIAAYSLLPGEDGSSGHAALSWRIPVVDWNVPVNLDGLSRAGLMCLQITAMLLASSVVRLTGTGRDLVEGLQSFHLPVLFVYSLDHTLGLIGGARRRGGARGGEAGPGGGAKKRAPQPGFPRILKRLLRGDVGVFVQSIRADVDRAGEQIAGETERNLTAQMAHDVAIVSGIALTPRLSSLPTRMSLTLSVGKPSRASSFACDAPALSFSPRLGFKVPAVAVASCSARTGSLDLVLGFVNGAR